MTTWDRAGHSDPHPAKIFDPFFTTRPQGTGIGVGLSICHGVVTAHGGAITVGDTPGGGARFVVHLPIGSGTDPILEDASAPAVAVPGRRLVIVEDEADVAHSLAEILAPDGYHIDLADSGAAALARIRAVDYDAILSDVRMADIGGLGWVFRPTAKNEVAAVALSCHRGESRRASRGLRLASRREAVCVVDG